MKRSHQSNPTHINGLPKDLVGNILTRLPIQEAVRTSILSRRWRYAWSKLPKLVFDDKFCEESIIKTKTKLIMAIYQVLFLHNGPLKAFNLDVSYLESSSPEIDQFLLVVLNKGIKDLSLCFGKYKPYKLPLSVFIYGQRLEHLKLLSCVFKPPPGFNGFKNLHSLELDEVDISSNIFSSIISHCPVLERLIFETSAGYKCIDIVAPNLKFLRVMSLRRPLCFKNTPKLATVIIHSSREEGDIFEASSHPILGGELPVVEYLELDCYCMEFVTSNEASRLLVKDLRLLRTLCLCDVSFGIYDIDNDIFSVLFLIRNSQNLETLQINVYTHENAPEIDITNAEDVSLDHLKKVELRYISGLNSELQFIKLILAKSPVLEKFTIQPDSGLVDDKGFKFFKELSRFRRASPLVEIAYEDWDGDVLLH